MGACACTELASYRVSSLKRKRLHTGSLHEAYAEGPMVALWGAFPEQRGFSGRKRARTKPALISNILYLLKVSTIQDRPAISFRYLHQSTHRHCHNPLNPPAPSFPLGYVFPAELGTSMLRASRKNRHGFSRERTFLSPHNAASPAGALQRYLAHKKLFLTSEVPLEVHTHLLLGFARRQARCLAHKKRFLMSKVPL